MGKAILAMIVSLVLGVLAEGLGTRWNMAGMLSKSAYPLLLPLFINW